MTWTTFMDMHSGGELKEEPYSYIFIEAPLEEAKAIFERRFGHDPDNVTCECCGEDYSLSEDETLEQATAYNRFCAFVYRRPDGAECSQAEAWKSGVGLVEGYTSGYEERDKPPPRYPQPRHIPFKVALKNGAFGRDKFLVIYAKDIKG